MKESTVRRLLHDLRSRVAAQLTQAVIAEYHRPAAYLRVGYEKIAICNIAKNYYNCDCVKITICNAKTYDFVYSYILLTCY